jgi:hypothetical protein
MAKSNEEKARKSRILAMPMAVGTSSRKSASDYAKAAGITLNLKEKRNATKVIKDRASISRGRTAARATNIAKVQAKKTAAKRAAASTGNITMTKKVVKKTSPKKK